MIADPQFSLQQVADVNKELCIQRVDVAAPQLDGVQRLKAVDHGLIQPKADAQHLNRFFFQARVADASPGGVTWQDTKQKKIKDDDEKNCENRPGDFTKDDAGSIQISRSHSVSSIEPSPQGGLHPAAMVIRTII